MTRANYLRVCYGKVQNNEDLLRHTRMILGALTGKDPRELVPLKGDYDHLKARSHDEILEMLERFGLKDKWIN